MASHFEKGWAPIILDTGAHEKVAVVVKVLSRGWFSSVTRVGHEKKSAMAIFFNKRIMHKNITLDPNDNKVEFWLTTFYVQTHFSAYYGMYQLSHDLAIDCIMHCIHMYIHTSYM